MAEQAVHDKGSEIPAGLNGLSSIDARRLLGEVGPNRWVKQDRFARVRELVSLLLDPMAVMLIIAAVVYAITVSPVALAALALAALAVVAAAAATGRRAARRAPEPARPSEPAEPAER